MHAKPSMLVRFSQFGTILTRGILIHWFFKLSGTWNEHFSSCRLSLYCIIKTWWQNLQNDLVCMVSMSELLTFLTLPAPFNVDLGVFQLSLMSTKGSWGICVSGGPSCSSATDSTTRSNSLFPLPPDEILALLLCWFISCLFRFLASLKTLSQYLHFYYFPLEWSIICAW